MARAVHTSLIRTRHFVERQLSKGWPMKHVLKTWNPAAASDRILHLRRRLAELDAWQDGSVKLVAQGAVRAEIARVGREMLEFEWRWI